LGQQIGHTALRQAASIHERAVALTPLVLINEWPVSLGQARFLASDLRTLIALLGFYRDVCEETPDPRCLDLVGDYCVHARTLLVQLGCVENEKDIVALSDWFEYNVVPWCVSMAASLKKMQQRHSRPTGQWS
jgi:phosphate uptake regulator